MPVSKAVNSAKADRIPAERYLDGMIIMQHAAIVAMKGALNDSRWIKAVEPWLIDMQLEKAGILEWGKLRAACEALMKPLARVAERQGFIMAWEYQG